MMTKTLPRTANATRAAALRAERLRVEKAARLLQEAGWTVVPPAEKDGK